MAITLRLRPSALNKGAFLEYAFGHARNKDFCLRNDFVEFKCCPDFTSDRKFYNWVKNHLPRRRLERFFTAVLKRGRVRVELGPPMGLDSLIYK